MRHAILAAASFTVTAAIAPPAHSQLATRTWVSGTGSDANTCLRAAPCATFAGALAKTAANGVIEALDPGDFGLLVISKSVTIDGHGKASITASALPLVAIKVEVGDGGVVTLRNLQLNGAGGGSEGVYVANAKQVNIENSKISGFIGNGILVGNPTGSGAQSLAITNSTISMNFSSGGLVGGIRTRFGVTTVSHSLIVHNGLGLMAESPGVINAESNVISGNTIGVYSSSPGSPSVASAIIRLSNNDVYGNLTGFGCGGGVLASNGTNRKGSNSGGGFAACAPTTTITEQ